MTLQTHASTVADWSQAKIGYTMKIGLVVLDASCGLVSGQDWLHSIDETATDLAVADWSQAKIGYTRSGSRGRTDRLRIGLRPRLVTLHSSLTCFQ